MKDERCQTVSGPFRCMHGINHEGPCEAQAKEYAPLNRRIAIAKNGVAPLPEPKAKP